MTRGSSSSAGVCTDGLPTNAVIPFPGNTALPDSVIYGISYDTSSPADALNVALHTADVPTVGTDPLPGTAFANSTFAGSYCDDGLAGTGTFRLDSPSSACWEPGDPGTAPYYIPAVQFQAIDVPADTNGSDSHGRAQRGHGELEPTLIRRRERDHRLHGDPREHRPRTRRGRRSLSARRPPRPQSTPVSPWVTSMTSR